MKSLGLHLVLVDDPIWQVHKKILSHTSWFKNKKGKSKNKNKSLNKIELYKLSEESQFQGDL